MKRAIVLLAAGAALCLGLSSFEPAAAQEAPKAGTSAKAKRMAAKRPRVTVFKRSSGYGPYGFLPGYRQPELNNTRPAKTYHYWRGYDWDGFPVGSWGTGGYGGMWYRGRFSNGLGPCYTRTPIGPMWNCG